MGVDGVAGLMRLEPCEAASTGEHSTWWPSRLQTQGGGKHTFI